jgi:hypothetical protein
MMGNMGALSNPNTYVQMTTPEAGYSPEYLKALGVGGVTNDSGVLFDMARADQMAMQASHPDFMDNPLGWAQSKAVDFVDMPLQKQLTYGSMGLGALGALDSMMGGSTPSARPAMPAQAPNAMWNAPLPKYGYAGTSSPTARGRNPYTGDIKTYGQRPEHNFFYPEQMVPMAEGGSVSGPGGPKDDKIPALLSNGEFVIPTDVVNALGGGNNDRGAGALHQMMKQTRKTKRHRRAA